jgi:serine/threonine protein kinase
MDDQVRRLFHELADLPDSERQRALADRQLAPELRAELESLFHFDPAGDGAMTACVSGVAEELLHSAAGPLVPECGPYRLVRLIGQGGMAEVYLGERTDGEIHRVVAVKLLGAGGHRSGWRDRFLKERQLLASLNHPSIVHVIDAGRTEDGRPYLVMEFVEGAAIDAYAASLDVRQRLLLFVKVCEGVSHAHRRLIIHRDLKPSNILVDSSGQPKLLDFGIAKLLDDTGNETRTVERLLTPNYASPEQLRGGSQTTATDIYSLGAVLYKMLTGRSPHESDEHTSQYAEILGGAREIPAPSRLNRSLPADLDYILRQALRIQPEERYASVDAFANDIRALLEFRPIEARSADSWYRTRKFLRRYWVPVVAAGLVIASLSAGLYLANQQRLVAEQRFAELRQLSNKVFDLDKAIRDLPGSMQARQTLVADSIEYLEGLSHAARGDLDLAREIGEGYWRVGRIQGMPNERNLGERAKAEASLKKAAQFVELVLASRPKDRNALYLAALIANDRMFLAEEEHRYSDAVAHGRKSAVSLDAFLELGDATEAERIDAVIRYGNIAVTYMDLHLYDEAIFYGRRELDLAKSIPAGRVPVNRGLIPLANAMRAGDLEGALHLFEEERKAAETTAYPYESMRINNLYGILMREGQILGDDGELSLGRTAEAIGVFQKAFEISEAAARKDPQDATSAVHAAHAGIALGNILRHGDARRALTVYDVALRRLDGIRNSLPAQRNEALALAGSTYALRSLGLASLARQRMDAAMAILKDIKDYPAEQYYFDTAAYTVLCALADHESASGEPRRAIQTYEDLLARTNEARESARSDLSAAFKLSILYATLGSLYRQTGDTAQADDLHTRRRELWQHWSRKLPYNPIVRRQIESANR